MNFDYDFNELFNSYNSLKIKKNDVIYISGNLLLLGKYLNQNILIDHLNVLKRIIGKGGTISFPTHSFSLIKNKKSIFDKKKTFSETGSLTEFLRKQKSAIRQFHPFSSTCAIGKYAKYICSKNTSHVYGVDSPFDRLIKLKAKFISFGIKPNFTAAQVHHAEFMMNVPYRYFKAFNQRVMVNGRLQNKKFFLFVLKENLINIKRDHNKKIFKFFLKHNKIIKKKLGKSFIYSYSFSDFYKSTIRLMKKDIYCWLSSDGKKKILKNKKISDLKQ